MVYQMARRDSDYSRVCRIAERGNNRDDPDSRARGEDGFSTHRFADRGSDGVYADARDFKIERLERRVQDLEARKPEVYVWDENFGEGGNPYGT